MTSGTDLAQVEAKTAQNKSRPGPLSNSEICLSLGRGAVPECRAEYGNSVLVPSLTGAWTSAAESRKCLFHRCYKHTSQSSGRSGEGVFTGGGVGGSTVCWGPLGEMSPSGGRRLFLFFFNIFFLLATISRVWHSRTYGSPEQQGVGGGIIRLS